MTTDHCTVNFEDHISVRLFHRLYQRSSSQPIKYIALVFFVILTLLMVVTGLLYTLILEENVGDVRMKLIKLGANSEQQFQPKIAPHYQDEARRVVIFSYDMKPIKLAELLMTNDDILTVVDREGLPDCAPKAKDGREADYAEQWDFVNAIRLVLQSCTFSGMPNASAPMDNVLVQNITDMDYMHQMCLNRKHTILHTRRSVPTKNGPPAGPKLDNALLMGEQGTHFIFLARDPRTLLLECYQTELESLRDGLVDENAVFAMNKNTEITDYYQAVCKRMRQDVVYFKESHHCQGYCSVFRYEDFLSEPKGNLTELYELMGVKLDRRLEMNETSFIEQWTSSQPEQAKWEDVLSAEFLEEFEVFCSEVLHFYRYPMKTEFFNME